MIIDCHGHVWNNTASGGQEADEIYNEAKRIGIDYCVLSEVVIAHTTPIEGIRKCNDDCFGAFNQYPDFFIPFVYTHPRLGQDGIDEVKRGLDMGARGVKLEVANQLTDKCCEPIIEICIENDIPLKQHTWHKINGNCTFETDPMHAAEVGRRYPELRLLMAHIGGDMRWGMRAIRDVPSILTDCSGSICDFGEIEQAVALLGADRVLWGTDIPGADYLYTLAKVRESSLSDEDKAKVLGLNCARMLKMDIQ